MEDAFKKKGRGWAEGGEAGTEAVESLVAAGGGVDAKRRGEGQDEDIKEISEILEGM